MQDFREYLRAYWAYVRAHLGWRKGVTVAVVWLAGFSAPLITRTFVALPDWLAIAWMISWSSLGYIFAPYGMWKAQRKK
jgi:hypothetical protein